MKYYYFQSLAQPAQFAFTDAEDGSKLPAEYGPWRRVRVYQSEGPWHHSASRDVVRVGLAENGFVLWDSKAEPSQKPILESDKVAGTAVIDEEGKEIGTIKRLLIDKASGRVVYADVIFGGFLGIGEKHQTIPWSLLRYDADASSYVCEVTEEQLHAAPGLYDDQSWPDREGEERFHQYWGAIVYW